MKIRINELARQLEVKSSKVIEKLSEFGLAEKVTHSSSIDDDMADRLRRYYGGDASQANETQRRNRSGSSTSVLDGEPETEQHDEPGHHEPAPPVAAAKPMEAKPAGQAKPAVDAKPVSEAKPVEAKPVDAKPVDAKPLESDTSEKPKPAEALKAVVAPPIRVAAPKRPAIGTIMQHVPLPVATPTPAPVAAPKAQSPAPQAQTDGSPAVAPAGGEDESSRPRNLPLRPPLLGRGTPIQPPLGFKPIVVNNPAAASPTGPSAPAASRPGPSIPAVRPLPPPRPAPVATPQSPGISSGQSSGPGRPVPPPTRPIPSGPGAPQAGPGSPGLGSPGPGAPGPRPGQVLSGPRQPLPGNFAPGAATNLAPGAPRPAAPQQFQGVRPGVPIGPPPRANINPGSNPGVPRPSGPGSPQQPQRPLIGQPPTRPLAGQPAARPIVPPRPDLVAKLGQQQQRPPMPGQAPQPRPGQPMRPPPQPRPGQPMYQGPPRPGQPPMQSRGPGGPGGPSSPGGFRPGGPGGRPGGPRPMHPTSRGPGLLGPGVPPPPPTTDTARRPQDRKRTQRDRQQEQEGKLLMQRRREQAAPPPISRDITISEGITVKELSEKLDVKANLVIKKLLDRGIFASINQTLDAKMSTDIAREFGASTSQVTYEEEAMLDVEFAEADTDLTRRPPVVTIMGHVDHGKTSLLDSIRQAHVADREAGGITQHIGAYHVEKNGQKIVFIDTPGHEAFTRMRARGAKVTDIVVLVVAADDGVMPQTLEAIDHARAAKVPIIVAINKIDKADAQVDRIKQQLSDRGLLAEDWGGDTVMVPVSARTKENLDTLLEMILLVAEIQDLKANVNRPAMATVLEAKLDRGRGPVATLLVKNGTLRVGDNFICGVVYGRVRAMIDDRGQQVKEVGPSMPVEVLGLEEIPEAGDSFQVVTDTTKAKQIVYYRAEKQRIAGLAKSSRMTLEQMQKQMATGDVKELFIVLKADVGGSAEVLKDTLERLSTEKITIRVLRSGVGAINESDVQLAAASSAIIVGFNVRPERGAAAVAEKEKVDLRLHTIIYEMVDEMKKAMTGMLAPVFKEIYYGSAEILEVFKVTKVGMVAGCMVREGHISSACKCRITRDNIVIFTGKIGSLRRFKDDVSDVRAGQECGITIDNFGDVKKGDTIEAFVMERVLQEIL